MLNCIKAEANRTFTENGAVTNRTSLSDCLDLFATVGALRHEDESEILTRFLRAFAENRDLATKTLFYARDVRGGLGERRVFRVILKWLANNHPTTVRKNLPFVAEYGRYDDLLTLMDTPCEKDALTYVKTELKRDLEALNTEGAEVSLLGKWLPSVNTSNRESVLLAKRIARFLGMSDAEYRKTLSALRARIRIIENNLRERDYTFDYSKMPSGAMFKYRKAFHRNDEERYRAFLEKVEKGEATLHTATLAPYELIDPYLHRMSWIKASIPEEERLSLNTTWNALPDFAGDEDALVVVDTSGSMYWGGNPLPASVAFSLGLYFAERNKGAFANHFITFSETPRLIELKGESFCDKLEYIASFNECANTNIEATFDLVLNTAVKNHLPPERLPARMIIISDMEFDGCAENASLTNFENAKAKFEAHGYSLPKLVFWNVNSRNENLPVTMNEKGVTLVSGCTPRLFSMVASDAATPYALMLEILESERYEKIVA